MVCRLHARPETSPPTTVAHEREACATLDRRRAATRGNDLGNDPSNEMRWGGDACPEDIGHRFRPTSTVVSIFAWQLPTGRFKKKLGFPPMIVTLEPRDAGQPVIQLSGTVTFGRRQENTVTWEDTYVSRDHAAIEISDGKVTLEARARDPTLIRVNRQPTTAKKELKDGDVVNFVHGRPNFAYTLRVRRSSPTTVVDDVDERPAKRAKESEEENELLDCLVCHGLLAFCHVLPCGHVGCGGCLRDWLHVNRQCPSCRHDVPADAPLPPVRVVDSLAELRAKSGDLPAADVADWKERRDKWLKARPPDGLRAPRDGPRSTAPRPMPPRPMPPPFQPPPPRVAPRRANHHRGHQSRSARDGAMRAFLRPMSGAPRPPRPPSAPTVINLTDDAPPAAHTAVIDLAS